MAAASSIAAGVWMLAAPWKGWMPLTLGLTAPTLGLPLEVAIPAAAVDQIGVLVAEEVLTGATGEKELMVKDGVEVE